MKKGILIVSLLLNAVFIVALFYTFTKVLDGCAEIADGRIGVLKKEIAVGFFNTKRKLFVLPKGLIVRDASAVGMDWFEPHRFRLVITSDSEDLVDYTVDPKKLRQDSEYYSADRN